jgi:hypothetical protein
MGVGEFFPAIKADVSTPFIAEVKNGGAIPLLPLCVHGMVLN